MPIKLGDALLYLGAKKDGLDRDLDQAERDTKGWVSRVSDGIGIAVGQAVVGAVGKLAQGFAQLGRNVVGYATDSRQAVGDLQAQLGATRGEAEALARVSQDLWKAGYTNSVREAATAVGQVRQQLGELNAQQILEVSKVGQALQDTYGDPFQKQLDATTTLVRDFGLTHQEALDFIAAGYQRGLNRSNDFLESITEYGPQFSSAQVEAGGFFSALESGMQGGVLGTDRAVDMFKEFRVRLLDGSKATSEGLQQIGLSMNDITSQINDGSLTWAGAFDLITGRLRATDDQAIQMQAGVALLGTQFEDMGTRAALGVDLASTSLEELEGAADKLNVKYSTLQGAATAVGRRMIAAFEPAVGAALDLVNEAMPAILGFFDRAEANIASFSTGVGAIIRGLAATIRSFVQAFRKDADEGLGQVAQNAGSWGRNITTQLARGMASAAVAVMRVIQQIGQMITSLLKPGSPPKILPDIDKWGAGTIEAWLDGMLSASVDRLKGLGQQITGTLQGVQDGALVSLYNSISSRVGQLFQAFGGEDDKGMIPAMFGSRAAIAQVIQDISSTGQIGEAAFTALQQALAPLPDTAVDYVEAMLEAAQASQQLEAAQERLANVTQEYRDQIGPLQEELQDMQDAQATAADQARIDELQAALARGNLSAEDAAEARRQIRARQLQIRIRELQDEQQAAEEAAQAEVDAAQDGMDAAQEQLELQQALIQAQEDQQQLTRQQVQLLDRLAVAMEGMGAAVADSIGSSLAGLGAGADGLGIDPEDPLGLGDLGEGMLDGFDIEGLADEIAAEFDPVVEMAGDVGEAWGTAATTLQGWWDSIKEGARAAIGGIFGEGEGGGLVGNAVQGMLNTWGLQFGAFQELFSGNIEGFLTGMVDAFGSWLGTLAGLLGDLWALAQPYVSQWLPAFLTWMNEQDWAAISQGILDHITGKLGEFWDQALPVVGGWWEALSEWFNEQDWAGLGITVLEMARDGLATYWSVWSSTVWGFWNSISDWFFERDWKQLGKDVITGILDGLAQLFEDAKNAPATLQGWWDDFLEWFGDQEWEDLAEKVVDGIVTGIRNGIGRAVGALVDLASGMWEGWQEWWDNHSPSRKMAAGMQDLVGGVEVGAQEYAGQAEAAMQDLAQRSFQAFQDGAAGVQQPATGAISAPGEATTTVNIENVNLQDATAVEAFLAWLSGSLDDRALVQFGAISGV